MHTPIIPLPRLLLGASLVAAALARLAADVTPAPVFTDHAVLQRGKPVPVWGTAEPGETVEVQFGRHSAHSVADDKGAWRLDLPALEASSEPAELTIRGKNTIVLKDVLVGEVWLASGQSNMEWILRNSYDRPLEVAASKSLSRIRELKVPRATSGTPLSSFKASWVVAGPETVGEFSAVAFHMAKELHLALGVPVGILNTTWGGTQIEAWMSAKVLDSEESFKVVGERWAETMAKYPERKAVWEKAKAEWEAEKAAAEAAGRRFTQQAPRAPVGPGFPSTPSGLYNAMLHPLLPYGIAGFIWYQGEANAGRASEYAKLFPAMIRSWRTDFGDDQLPFYWVQLAKFAAGSPDDVTWAGLREAQHKTLELPATGEVLTIDIGDVGDIHPRNKADVGRRFARLALNRHYGIAMPDSGPLYAASERNGNSFTVKFTEVQGGLRTQARELKGFELAGDDRNFVPAEARIEGKDTVVVRSAAVAKPVAVRYAWRNAPEAGLINSEGLPAAPFRTDDW